MELRLFLPGAMRKAAVRSIPWHDAERRQVSGDSPRIGRAAKRRSKIDRIALAPCALGDARYSPATTWAVSTSASDTNAPLDKAMIAAAGNPLNTIFRTLKKRMGVWRFPQSRI